MNMKGKPSLVLTGKDLESLIRDYLINLKNEVTRISWTRSVYPNGQKHEVVILPSEFTIKVYTQEKEPEPSSAFKEESSLTGE